MLSPFLSPLAKHDIADTTTTIQIVNPHTVTTFISATWCPGHTHTAQHEVEEKSLAKQTHFPIPACKLSVLQGTPEPQNEAEEKTLAAAVEKDGKPLPGAADKDGKPLPGAADSKDLKIATSPRVATSPKSRKAEPVYIPRGPLKSKYHIQVCLENALTPAFIIINPCTFLVFRTHQGSQQTVTGKRSYSKR